MLDGNYIGNIGCHNIDYDNDSLEVGYWIGKPYWGKGYMSNALNLFLDFVKKRFNPVRVVAYHYSFNPASGKVMRKCGFKYEGTRRKVKKGFIKYFDDEMYSLILRK